jgi:hypothetical protein
MALSSQKWVCINGYQWVKVSLSLILFRSRTFAHVLSLTHFRSRIIEIRFYEKEFVYWKQLGTFQGQLILFFGFVIMFYKYIVTCNVNGIYLHVTICKNL